MVGHIRPMLLDFLRLIAESPGEKGVLGNVAPRIGGILRILFKILDCALG